MARIFITGSSDGIGQAAVKLLCEQGHEVYPHARNAERASQAKSAIPGAKDILIADLSKQDETKNLASQVNKLGPFDTIVHNAGLGFDTKPVTEGLAPVFVVNSLAPYILTCLLDRPKRLLYMSSSLHLGGDPSLEDMGWTSGKRTWDGFQAYSDTKLQNVMLALAVSRGFHDVNVHAMDPGWVQTKMGGPGAPGGVAAPARVLAAYAAGEHGLARSSGTYFNVQGLAEPLGAAKEVGRQEEFLRKCEEICGLALSS